MQYARPALQLRLLLSFFFSFPGKVSAAARDPRNSSFCSLHHVIRAQHMAKATSAQHHIPHLSLAVQKTRGPYQNLALGMQNTFALPYLSLVVQVTWALNVFGPAPTRSLLVQISYVSYYTRDVPLVIALHRCQQVVGS